MKKEKRLTTILLVIYLVLLTWIILFKMATSVDGIPHLRGVNLIPFGASLITNDRLDTSELLDNVLAFIPLGLYLGSLMQKQAFWKKLLSIALVSIGYEVLQYIFSIGASDITDVIDNTLGGLIGILLYLILKKLFRQKADWILNGICTVATTLGIAFFGVLLAVN